MSSNDFEMVRDYIQRADRTFGQGPGPRAALDRIEAEVERLRTERVQAEETWRMVARERDAEIERLRGAVTMTRLTSRKLSADNERLRGDNETLQAENGRIMNTFQKAQVERLRAALEQIVEANVSHFHQEPCWENCKYPDCDSDAHEWHTHIGGGSIARAALAKEES